MKRLLALFALLIAGCTALVTAKVTPTNPEQKLIIVRVTSLKATEEMTFDASYIFHAGDSQLQHIERKTPFEVKMKSEFVAGIFRKKSGEGDLQVALTTSVDGKTEENHVTGSGDIIVLGTVPGAENRFSVNALSTK